MTMDILRPDSGRILINGRPSIDADHDRVGYLPEERGLYRKQKVIDVLDYFGRLKGMKGPDVKARAKAALERVGLGEWAGKRVDALSKGMQQKVADRRNPPSRAEVVILDEPFTGLDPVNARMVKEIIGTLKRDGRLVVLSTHQMDQVEELCDRIVMIDRGKRVLYGTVREIKKRYAEEIRTSAERGNVVVVDGEGDFAGLPGVFGHKGGGRRGALDLGAGSQTRGFPGPSDRRRHDDLALRGGADPARGDLRARRDGERGRGGMKGKTAIVVRHEFFGTIKRPSWLIGTFGMPVFVGLYAGLIFLIGSTAANMDKPTGKAGVVDRSAVVRFETGPVAAGEIPDAARKAVDDAVSMAGASGGSASGFVKTLLAGTEFVPFADEESALAALGARKSARCTSFRRTTSPRGKSPPTAGASRSSRRGSSRKSLSGGCS